MAPAYSMGNGRGMSAYCTGLLGPARPKEGAHLDVATKSGSGTLPEPAGGTPTLRSAVPKALGTAGWRGFPAPHRLRLLSNLAAMSRGAP